jgi:hypothetical protein
MDQKMLIPLTKNEMKKVNGGIFIAVAAITIAYSCWAATFIYNMGKDGESGLSNKDRNR